MNIPKLTAKRTDYCADGIFSEVFDEGEVNPFMVTMEHSYAHDSPGGIVYLPKLQPGIYRCVFGHHTLHSGPVETYEVTGVEGHSGILFPHIGNYNADSDGCACCGRSISHDMSGMQFVTNSGDTFKAFIRKMRGIPEFDLEVIA